MLSPEKVYLANWGEEAMLFADLLEERGHPAAGFVREKMAGISTRVQMADERKFNESFAPVIKLYHNPPGPQMTEKRKAMHIPWGSKVERHYTKEELLRKGPGVYVDAMELVAG